MLPRVSTTRPRRTASLTTRIQRRSEKSHPAAHSGLETLALDGLRDSPGNLLPSQSTHLLVNPVVSDDLEEPLLHHQEQEHPVPSPGSVDADGEKRPIRPPPRRLERQQVMDHVHHDLSRGFRLRFFDRSRDGVEGLLADVFSKLARYFHRDYHRPLAPPPPKLPPPPRNPPPPPNPPGNPPWLPPR